MDAFHIFKIVQMVEDRAKRLILKLDNVHNTVLNLLNLLRPMTRFALAQFKKREKHP